MAPRVILGKRSGVEGLWVSRPGCSALSTSPGDFLIDTSKENSIAFMRGSFNSMPYAGETSQAGVPAHFYQLVVNHNLGFVPFIWSMKNLDGTPQPTSYLTAFPANYNIFVTSTQFLAQGFQPYSNAGTQPPTGFTLGFTLTYVIFQNRLGV